MKISTREYKLNQKLRLWWAAANYQRENQKNINKREDRNTYTRRIKWTRKTILRPRSICMLIDLWNTVHDSKYLNLEQSTDPELIVIWIYSWKEFSFQAFSWTYVSCFASTQYSISETTLQRSMMVTCERNKRDYRTSYLDY